MENFYCGDIVEPGTHLSLEDVVHYFNIFNGDVQLSELSAVEHRLLNISNSEQSVTPDREQLNILYSMVAGEVEPILCNDDPVECCKDKVTINTHGWDDQTFRPSVGGISVRGFNEDGMFCIDAGDSDADGKGYPYGFLVKKSSGGTFYGKIMAGTNLMNKEVVYLEQTGDQYRGKITSGSGSFDNELEYVGRCMLSGFTDSAES